jgi:general L-amino acid transport system permease protein
MQLSGRRIVQIRQVLVLALLAAIVYAVVSNVGSNLQRRGLSLSFEFLGRPASFDIPFKLIDFTSRDTYARAALVAVLNTILVACLAIVTATIVGVAFGTFLLSPNPLLRRTALLFVEVIKNTPQLLQVLFWYVVILRQLPNARESYQPVTSVYLNVRGLFLPTIQMAAPEGRIWLAWAAIAAAVALVVYGVRQLFVPQRAEMRKILGIAFGLAVLAVASWLASGAQASLSRPELRGFNFRGGVQIVPELIALWVGLAIYASSFIADLVRGAVLAVPKGQEEAAYALGLKHGQTLRLVKLPQALQIVVPPLVSQYLNITKSSTLGIAIAYPEIMTVLGGTTLNQTGQAIETMLIIMAVFILINLVVSALMNRYNRHVALRGHA